MSRAADHKTGRIHWVDVLRFLGMILIYWGHLGVSESVTLYIFAHHVPLFFFISGFFAGLSPSFEGNAPSGSSFFRFLWKKIRSIVFPYIFFTLTFYILQLAAGELAWSDLPQALLISAGGIRNQVPGPLWFLTCLFVVTVAFELIKRLLFVIFGNGKAGRAAAVIAAAAIFAVGILCLGHEPAQDPQWIWNVDSAFIYLFYYALGAWFFPVIRDWKYRRKKKAGQIVFFLCFGLSAAFAVFTLLYGVTFTEQIRTLLSSLTANEAVNAALFEVYAFVSALILIFLELCIARILSLIPGLGRFFAFVGKDSLYLCGNELIIKFFGSMAIAALGLQSLMGNDLFLLLYSLVCILVLTFTLDLLERLLLHRLFHSAR